MKIEAALTRFRSQHARYPCSLSACSRSAAAFSPQNTQTGTCFAVVAECAVSGSRKSRSSTTRTGDWPAMPGNRQVSAGSSDCTVPIPVRIASFIARIRCTRARVSSPVIGAGLRPARPALPSAGHRELQRHMRAAIEDAADMTGMVAPRLLGADARSSPRCRPRAAFRRRGPPLPDWGPRSPRRRAQCRPR